MFEIIAVHSGLRKKNSAVSQNSTEETNLFEEKSSYIS